MFKIELMLEAVCAAVCNLSAAVVAVLVTVGLLTTMSVRVFVTLFTFWRGAQKALVVELMPQSSCARKQRSLCASQGMAG